MYRSKPNEYSFGEQEYNYHRNISGFEAVLKSDLKVQNVQMHKGEMPVESKLLEEYIDNAKEQLQKFEEYQMGFDNLLKSDNDEKFPITTKILFHSFK